ncbi:U2 small nuclear ribonucleoprotein auxiliary factor 35 kDa subunit-related protein 1 [Blattella germanica]|nr:U2 small nuclear ribonucleoprotein auxiliary factor 35 kDa subunit-related protein 1 [Blattella germanica]
MKEIDDFIKHGGELPPSVNISTETHPDKPLCPFFTKTGACRFGDHCSRNHPRPGISRVLLFTNFYTHFGLHQSMLDEYDTDLMLEYEDLETYQHFKEFYDDVLPEFEQFGRVIQFKVCCNHEPHLRGNVYVEYESTRDSVLAFQKFHGRWYGGRQLNVEFTCVSSWKSAICGLFFKRRCPKGRSCNFLHVFRNPGNAFSEFEYDRELSRRRHGSKLRSRSPSFSPARNRSQRNRDDRRDWRWSESPEPPEINVNGDNKHNKSRKSSPKSRNGSRSEDRKKKRDRGNDYRRSKSRTRNRSRSSSQSRSSRTSNSHRKSRRRKSRSRSRSN